MSGISAAHSRTTRARSHASLKRQRTPSARLSALALALVYLAVGATIFFIAFRNARHRGALLQMGE